MDNKKIKKRPPKTLKERAFMYEYANNGGNATKAVIAAGYNVGSEKGAGIIGVKNMKKLDFSQIYAKMGLTDEAIAANTTRIALSSKKRDQFTGELETDDAMQLKGMDFAVRMMGKMPKDEPQGNTYIQYIENQKNQYGI